MMSDVEIYEARLRVAMLASDVAELDRLIADDLIFTAFNGQLVTKEQDLEMHRSGSIKIEELDVLELLAREVGEVALVVAHVRISGSFDNQPASGEFRFTRVWQMKQEGWQIVAGACVAVS